VVLTAEPTEETEAAPEPTDEPTEVDEDEVEGQAQDATTDSPPLDSRAEMDESTRMLMEVAFVQVIREEGIGQLYTDDELIAGGDVSCDAWDGGKPLRGVLVDVAEELPRLEDTEAVAILAGVATRSLCPEHAAD
jgi:Protein of unknown function (DUF732)